MAALDAVLQAAGKFNASDIHIAPGEPYVFRQFGRLRKVQGNKLTDAQCRQLIAEVLTTQQQAQLEKEMQLDFALQLPDGSRFRGSAMNHHRGMSATFRAIPKTIPSFDALGLPGPLIEKILDNHQGLILVTGATGQGKSTTLAAMVDYINRTRAHHVLTIEDPIEFIHPIHKAVVNQRQIGSSTRSYANALRAALREDPDVIMVGELRDAETISLAISAAETGHLVLGTLSTSSAPKTIDRIIDSFPANEQNQIRAMVSESLKAVVTQRLVPGADGTRMVLACEILIGTLPIANLIREGKGFQIGSAMQTGRSLGMQLLDDALMELVQDGKITATQAVRFAVSKNKFKALVQKEEGQAPA